jgi:hypothetical protein
MLSDRVSAFQTAENSATGHVKLTGQKVIATDSECGHRGA